MGEQIITTIGAVATALIGLAIIATLVSRQADTSQVIGAAASGFARDLQAATNPFSGGGFAGLTGGGGGFGVGSYGGY